MTSGLKTFIFALNLLNKLAYIVMNAERRRMMGQIIAIKDYLDTSPAVYPIALIMCENPIKMKVPPDSYDACKRMDCQLYIYLMLVEMGVILAANDEI